MTAERQPSTPDSLSSAGSADPPTRSTPARLTPPPWLILVDVAIVVLVLLALWVWAFTGFRLYVFGLRVSIRSIDRLLIAAVVLRGLRFFVWRHLPPYRHLRQRWQDALARWPAFGATAAIAIGTRVTVLAVGLLSVWLVGYSGDGQPPYRFSPHELLNLPARWDAGWYVGIATDGYRWSPSLYDQQNIVFFPAYPLLMRGLMLIVGANTALAASWAGVLISVTSFALALALIYRIAADRFDKDVALAAVLFLASYPLALYYSVTYTEGLFLLANVAAFYAFERQRFVLAAAAGLLAGLTRPNGCLLSVALALVLVCREWTPTLASYRARLTLPIGIKGLAAAAMPGVGMILHSVYVWTLTGDALAWMHHQRAWARSVSLFDPGVLQQFRTPEYTLHAAAFLFAIAGLWPVARRIGIGAATFVAVSVLLPFINGGLISMGRFTAVLFPLFIWLALIVPAERRALVAALFGIGQGFAGVLFFTWRWMI